MTTTSTLLERTLEHEADTATNAAISAGAAGTGAGATELEPALSAPAQGLFGGMLWHGQRGPEGPVAELQRIRADAAAFLTLDRSGKNPDFDEIRAIVQALDAMLAQHKWLGEKLKRIAKANPAKPTTPAQPE